jgi:glycosyltransferase involved in cell wall biosynthesis
MDILLEVMHRMARAPVEFWIVGAVSVNVPDALRRQANIRWEGAVARSRAADYYRNADVFVFPTHSDGFGLTQLEAQAWKLPVIASEFCGEVVRDGENGVILRPLCTNALHAAFERFLEKPEELAEMSRESGVDPKFSLCALSHNLTELIEVIRCSKD